MGARKIIATLPTKITQVMKAVAGPIGVAKGFLTDPMADGRGLEGIVPFATDRLSQFKLANPLLTTMYAWNLGEDYYPLLSSAAMLAIGWVGKEVLKDIEGVPYKGAFNNIAGACMAYGGAALISSLVAAWIWLAPFNPHSSKSTGGQPPATTSGRVPPVLGSFETATPSRGGFITPML